LLREAELRRAKSVVKRPSDIIAPTRMTSAIMTSTSVKPPRRRWLARIRTLR
jgi:hypothetical protein